MGTVLVAGCTHDAWKISGSAAQQFAEEYGSNFKTIVLEGRNIDDNQTWNTAVTTQVSVSVVKAGTLKIYSANPFGNTVAPLYESVVDAGQQVTATLIRPQNVTTLYATILDDEGYIIDNMSFAAQIMRMMDRYNPDAVFVDGGRGEGVIDRCRQMG